MIKEKLKKILTFNGVAIIIGILGSLASILTVFITKWDLQISLKWLIFILFVSLTIILISIKVALDLNSELKIKRITTFPALRYLTENSTFLVQTNDILGYSAMVSIFYLDDSFEIELGKGYVKNIQEKFIQIQMIQISDEFQKNHGDILIKIKKKDKDNLNKIIIKSYVSYSK